MPVYIKIIKIVQVIQKLWEEHTGTIIIYMECLNIIRDEVYIWEGMCLKTIKHTSDARINSRVTHFKVQKQTREILLLRSVFLSIMM